MAAETKAQDRSGIGHESALAGMLALLIDEREDRTRDDKDAAKTEVLLAQAGLSIEDISTVTGKKYDTVRMAITRGKKTKPRA
jgi:DNA-directed RNA polymerase specialized sigma24 family protein